MRNRRDLLIAIVVALLVTGGVARFLVALGASAAPDPATGRTEAYKSSLASDVWSFTTAPEAMILIGVSAAAILTYCVLLCMDLRRWRRNRRPPNGA